VTGPNGVKTAVALAGGVGDLGFGEAEDQDDLFAAECDGPLTPAPVGKSGPKGGRPAGARNRSTEAVRQMFLQRYRSPLMGLGETYSRPSVALARELGMTRTVKFVPPGHEVLQTVVHENGCEYVVWDLERAFRLQKEAMEAALPYVHQKLPQAITVQERQRGLLVIQGLGDQASEDAVLVFDTEQNQQVIDAEAQQSETSKSETKHNQQDGGNDA
jgi:hypothetical protein